MLSFPSLYFFSSETPVFWVTFYILSHWHPQHFLLTQVINFFVSVTLFFISKAPLFSVCLFHGCGQVRSVKILMLWISSIPLPNQVPFPLIPSSSLCLWTVASASHDSGLPLVALGCVLMFESGVYKLRPPAVALKCPPPHFRWKPGLWGLWLIPGRLPTSANKNTCLPVRSEYQIYNKFLSISMSRVVFTWQP